jgi:hypothetical protein
MRDHLTERKRHYGAVANENETAAQSGRISLRKVNGFHVRRTPAERATTS